MVFKKKGKKMVLVVEGRGATTVRKMGRRKRKGWMESGRELPLLFPREGQEKKISPSFSLSLCLPNCRTIAPRFLIFSLQGP